MQYKIFPVLFKKICSIKIVCRYKSSWEQLRGNDGDVETSQSCEAHFKPAND